MKPVHFDYCKYNLHFGYNCFFNFVCETLSRDHFGNGSHPGLMTPRQAGCKQIYHLFNGTQKRFFTIHQHLVLNGKTKTTI